MQYSGSPFSAVYEAKYFPHCDFLSSTLGSKHSYIWQSICEAKAIIKLGCMWCIGKGDQVNIWQDNWLPHSCTRRVFASCNTLLAIACVSDLLDASNTGGWNSFLINKVFLPFEAKAILKIPLLLH